MAPFLISVVKSIRGTRLGAQMRRFWPPIPETPAMQGFSLRACLWGFFQRLTRRQEKLRRTPCGSLVCHSTWQEELRQAPLACLSATSFLCFSSELGQKASWKSSKVDKFVKSLNGFSLEPHQQTSKKKRENEGYLVLPAIPTERRNIFAGQSRVDKGASALAPVGFIYWLYLEQLCNYCQLLLPFYIMYLCCLFVYLSGGGLRTPCHEYHLFNFLLYVLHYLRRV